MVTQTVDVGHARQSQYNPGAKRHAVVGDRESGWTLVCTGGPATREYRGFVGAVECEKCRKLLPGLGPR